VIAVLFVLRLCLGLGSRSPSYDAPTYTPPPRIEFQPAAPRGVDPDVQKALDDIDRDRRQREREKFNRPGGVGPGRDDDDPPPFGPGRDGRAPRPAPGVRRP
jgi:hypothetical protein